MQTIKARQNTMGFVLLFYGVVGFLLASNTIDIYPGGLINVKLPEPAIRPIYAIFNPIALAFPYISSASGGLPLEIWNPCVILINWAYPMLFIIAGILILVKPKIRMISGKNKVR